MLGPFSHALEGVCCVQTCRLLRFTLYRKTHTTLTHDRGATINRRAALFGRPTFMFVPSVDLCARFWAHARHYSIQDSFLAQGFLAKVSYNSANAVELFFTDWTGRCCNEVFPRSGLPVRHLLMGVQR